MPEPVLVEKSVKPNDTILKELMGKAFTHFAKFRQLTSGFAQEWKFYTKKSGWTFKIQGKKKAICYVTPWPKSFRIGMAIAEKEKGHVLASNLPKAALNEFKKARKYPEGYPLRFDIKTAKDLNMAVKFFQLIGRIE
jgi:hypothetical protein